jgi:glycosyltransferase involved in cell wall biosynthesis
MRVLFVIASLERGGSEGQLVELLARIHPAPVAATVATIAPARDRRHTERLLACDVRQIVLAPGGGSRLRRSVVAALQFGRLLRRLRPDVVYAWGESPSLLAVPLARLHGIPVVLARRSSGNANLMRGLDRAARWIEARAALVTVNSVAALEEARRRGVPRGRLRLVPNGHDAGRPAPAPGGQEVRLGYVAALRPGKGHRRLLEALRDVRANARWHVELAGTGPLLGELRAEVRERGLAERVRFLGTVDDIPRFWRDRDACLLLSDCEGSSNALIEAGLAGRPLVASDVPGNRELVSPGSGILVRADDVTATALRLEEIIDDAELREHLGRGAWEAMQRFEVERMVAGHLDALVECRRLARSG